MGEEAPCFSLKKRARIPGVVWFRGERGNILDQFINPTEAIYSDLVNDEDLRGIVALFVEEMEGRISKIESEYASSDFYSLGRTVHQLKGAAGSYGFAKISQAAATVEEKVRDAASDEEIGKSVKELIALCRLTKIAPPQL